MWPDARRRKLCRNRKPQDEAGKGIANPLAAIWSASQLLDHFGYDKWGSAIIDAIEIMLTDHKDELTPDQGGRASTSECGDALVKVLAQISKQYPEK